MVILMRFTDGMIFQSTQFLKIKGNQQKNSKYEDNDRKHRKSTVSDHWVRPCRIHRSHLRSPRRPKAYNVSGHAAGRPAYHHHRSRKLPRLSRRRAGAQDDGRYEKTSRTLWHRSALGRNHRYRYPRAAFQSNHRRRQTTACRNSNYFYRCFCKMDRAAQRERIQRLWRVGMRHLRWIFLSWQSGSGSGWRRYRRGRSYLSGQTR